MREAMVAYNNPSGTQKLHFKFVKGPYPYITMIDPQRSWSSRSHDVLEPLRPSASESLDGKIDDPTSSLVWMEDILCHSKNYDRTLSSVVWSEEKEDETTDRAVDRMCEAIMAYINPSRIQELRFLFVKEHYVRKICHLDPQGSWSSCSEFLAFCKQYRSKFDKFMEGYSRVGVYCKEDVLPDHRAKTRPFAMLDDDVLERPQNFKRFDIVEDFSDHLFSALSMEKISKYRVERICEERMDLEKNLPETIFVRVYASRMDLLTAVIIGPKGTPYHDGLFFFDVLLHPTFPIHPPLVRYRSGGFAINPHMFECGEVRLNLIRSWAFDTETMWSPAVTSVLRLLIALQERVLNSEPLFNQPAFINSGPTVVSEYFSMLYNENILIKSLKIMIYIMNKPPKNFEAFVVGHFRSRVHDILEACSGYMDGRPVGFVGGNKKSCCSYEFRHAVASCIPELVASFKKIGATEADYFSILRQSAGFLGEEQETDVGKDEDLYDDVGDLFLEPLRTSDTESPPQVILGENTNDVVKDEAHHAPSDEIPRLSGSESALSQDSAYISRATLVQGSRQKNWRCAIIKNFLNFKFKLKLQLKSTNKHFFGLELDDC